MKRRKKKRSVVTEPSQAEKLRQQLPDAADWQMEIILQCQPFTMTSPERLLALCNAVEYVVRHQIPGDIVECGVWRGGSMAAIAKTLQHLGDTDRNLWLYDTFEGMSEPTQVDVDCWGNDAQELLDDQDRDDAKSVWCVSGLTEVQNLMRQTGYAYDQIEFVVGKVEETLPARIPEDISLLRLDTDWYESTRHELETLYPRLANAGVLIIDDYGHWDGCRRAVDEYLTNHSIPMLLNRIDYTGRLGIKPGITTQPGTKKAQDAA